MITTPDNLGFFPCRSFFSPKAKHAIHKHITDIKHIFLSVLWSSLKCCPRKVMFFIKNLIKGIFDWSFYLLAFVAIFWSKGKSCRLEQRLQTKLCDLSIQFQISGLDSYVTKTFYCHAGPNEFDPTAERKWFKTTKVLGIKSLYIFKITYNGWELFMNLKGEVKTTSQEAGY